MVVNTRNASYDQITNEAPGIINDFCHFSITTKENEYCFFSIGTQKKV